MKVVTTEQMRALDRRTIAAGTPGEVLMDRAGFAVARRVGELLRRRGGQSALFLAGKGNNGGDAIVAARHLAAAGGSATLLLFCRRGELRGDPLLHFQRLLNVTVVELPTVEQLGQLVRDTDPGVIVDGLLGTGLNGDVREPSAGVIRWLNELPALDPQHSALILSIDVPSGLDSDTGAVRGAAVRADVTVTMGQPKIGLLRGAALDHVGALEVADIGFPPSFVAEIATAVELLTAAEARAVLPRRRREAHKGDFGHLLIVAGSEGYTGAPVLCGQAAARAGAGLVTLAVPREIYPIVAANCPPEVMPQPLDRLGSLSDFDAVALGPGLGQDEAVQRQVLRWLDECRRPMVVDADGLNALARNVSVLNRIRAPLVLTPHPGEMARLIGKTVAEVQARRWEVAREFAANHEAVLVLKGAGTVVTDKTGPLWVNMTGNPGMAKGGMGDALTGIIGALLAQGLTPLNAAQAGVFVHGQAGDLAAERCGETALLATDVITSLGDVWRALAGR